MLGIFDSGIGGLTVVRAIEHAVPDVSYLYLGDTAHLPYGTKTADTITRYTLDALAFLKTQGATVPVIACHTASSVIAANEDLRESIRNMFGHEPYTVVDAALRGVPKHTKSGSIGILATTATIRSGIYQQRLENFTLTPVAASVLVGLAEEGFSAPKHVQPILEEVLNPFLRSDVDTVVLGCTHFPVLADSIRDILGPDVVLLDPGKELARVLQQQQLVKDGKRLFFASDIPEDFGERAGRFLGRRIAVSRTA